MKPINSLKTEIGDFEVEFEVLSAEEAQLPEISKAETELMICDIDQQLVAKQKEIDKLDAQIDKLTNHADGIDYATAVTCGLVTGIIDALFVGEWDFKSAKAASNEEINNRIIDFAKKDPEYQEYLEKRRHSNSDKENAIAFLEKKYKLPGDGEYKAFSSLGVTNATHHLDDFSHHPTLLGVISAIMVQFSGDAKYHCAGGEVIQATIQVNQYGNLVSNDTYGKIFSGIINWFFTVAKTMQNQRGHLFSDMGGSSTSAGKGNDGAGLPGSFLSTLKELSTLECFKDTKFGENLRKVFQNGIGEGKKQLDLGPFNSLFEGASSKFDMRTEMAIGKELKRQALPVILNEILVRATYFVRRFILQMKAKKTILEIDWKETIPMGNRTIERMMTIASGTFMAVDMADAAIQSAIKSGGITPAFASNMVLRVNFVGIGRFTVALGTDSVMGISRNVHRNKRLQVVNEIIVLNNAKVYYKQAEMWIEAENTEKEIEEMYETMEASIGYLVESAKDIALDMAEIKARIPDITANNSHKIEEYVKALRR